MSGKADLLTSVSRYGQGNLRNLRNLRKLRMHACY